MFFDILFVRELKNIYLFHIMICLLILVQCIHVFFETLNIFFIYKVYNIIILHNNVLYFNIFVSLS